MKENDESNNSVNKNLRKRLPKEKLLKSTTQQKILGGIKNTYEYANASISCEHCPADPTGH